jgi:hypothetical protein
MKYKCPARESSKFLCDKVAEYQIEGTVWCNTHARRVIDKELNEEPTADQLNEAFRAMIKEAQKPNVSIDFEIWDVVDREVS